MNKLADVEAFHAKFDIGYDGPPRFPDRDLKMFRLRFLAEELIELGKALGVGVAVTFDYDGEPDRSSHEARLVEALDALLDLEYVLLGTTSLLGLSGAWDAGWDRVHAANLTKERGRKPGRDFSDARWDITKPPGWRAADLSDLVVLP